MSKKIEPKLRFPEFNKDGEWTSSELGDESFSKIITDRVTVENIKIGTYISTENMLQNFGGVTPSSNPPSAGSFTSFLKDDILMSNIRPYLRKVWRAVNSGAASNDVIIFRSGEKTLPGFIEYILKSDSFIDYVMKGAEGVKMPRGDKDAIRKYPVAFPEKKEQKKIADCLYFLDDLITAQHDKVEVLINYKKSLLQQLFPQDGETVPRLRFPEFKNSGDWSVIPLGEIASYENGKAHEQDISDDGKYIVANSKFISTDGDVKKFTNTPFCLAGKDNILMVLSDVPNGRAIAKCYYVERDNYITVNQRICKIVSSKADTRFLFYLLNRNPYFLKFDDGVKQTNLSKDDVLNCPLYLPEDKKEQEKLSSFLLSLDLFIESESQNTESLKEHKRGLLQQLFPKIEGGSECL